MLRMNNIQAEGWVLDDLKYVDLEPDEVEKYRLDDGDLVFNRTNSKELVGKSEVFRQGQMPDGYGGPVVYASYLIRVALDQEQAMPDFVSSFLDTPAGRLQIDRVSRQIAGMTNINGEELRQLVVPLPPVDHQRRLAAELDDARASWRRKHDEADGLLAGLGGYLMDALGLVLPDRQSGSAYAVRVRDLSTEGRLDADYFDPERTQTLAALAAHAGRLHPQRLDAVAAFVRDRQDADDGARYLGLADVRSNTGELAPEPQDHPGTTCYAFQEGDVLYSRLRPNLNKVYRAEFGGVCSPEFHVVRILPELRDRLLPDFLAAVLRSPLTLAQTQHMTTGNTHPRLSNDDVQKLAVPVPDLALQERAVDELRQRRVRARQLRAEAAQEWVEARAAFEARLIGDPN